MPICGPNLSICCTLLSIWGIIMLVLMGIFFHIHSPALFEDIPFSGSAWEQRNFTKAYIYEKYDQVAINCYIGAGIYALFLMFSYVQHRMHVKEANYESL